MGKKIVLLVALIVSLSCCYKSTKINEVECDIKNSLDKNKLKSLLDEVLAEDKLGKWFEYYNVDPGKYNGNYDLIYEGDGRWFFNPWSILKISRNEYKMVAATDYGDGSLQFIIEFETGKKYVAKSWDVEELHYSMESEK